MCAVIEIYSLSHQYEDLNGLQRERRGVLQVVDQATRGGDDNVGVPDFFEFQNSLILFLRGNCIAAHLLSVASCTFRSSPPTERPISTEVNWANCLET